MLICQLPSVFIQASGIGAILSERMVLSLLSAEDTLGVTRGKVWGACTLYFPVVFWWSVQDLLSNPGHERSITFCVMPEASS